MFHGFELRFRIRFVIADRRPWMTFCNTGIGKKEGHWLCVQKLLEMCTSVKVKRLFLYMAESGRLPRLEEIGLGRINLGKGDRTVIKGGRLDPKYRITVPPREAG